MYRYIYRSCGVHVLRTLAVAALAVFTWPDAGFAAQPTVESDPAHNSGDTADDPLIWIHPTDPALSLVIGDDKGSGGGLIVYGLDGKERQFVQGSEYNNSDIRYHFPLSGTFSTGEQHTSVALVAIGEESGEVVLYKVNPHARTLEDVSRFPSTGVAGGTILPYGGCMYLSQVTGDYYFFVTTKAGPVTQYKLVISGNTVTGEPVRELPVGSQTVGNQTEDCQMEACQTEGCVADDILGHVYVGEEAAGIWKYGAEPDAGTTPTQVDVTGGGNLVADVEGLTIYYRADGTGYLIASSQGDNSFSVYTREGENTFVGNFRVEANGAIDASEGTDGLDVTNFPLGPDFPEGLLVVHDSENEGAEASNYKFVPWQNVATELGLTSDTTWDPRAVAPPGGGSPQPAPPAAPPAEDPTTPADPTPPTDPTTPDPGPITNPPGGSGGSPSPGTVSIVDSSPSLPGHPPENALDGDPTTVWSSTGSVTWLLLDLGKPSVPEAVEIDWYDSQTRQNRFSLYASQDQQHWFNLTPQPESSTQGVSGFQTHTLQYPLLMRYMIIAVHGDSDADTANISEVRFRETLQCR